MCPPCVVIINCCGRLGSSAQALAIAQESIGESFKVLYDNGNLSAADLDSIAKLGEKSADFAQSCDALRFEGLDLLYRISTRTKGYNDPKKEGHS